MRNYFICNSTDNALKRHYLLSYGTQRHARFEMVLKYFSQIGLNPQTVAFNSQRFASAPDYGLLKYMHIF